MNSKLITASEALERLKNGENLTGLTIDFATEKVKALDAFALGKAGIEVPDEVIEYDDANIAYDPEFDDYEWKRIDFDPLEGLQKRLTVSIAIDQEVKEWVHKNGVAIDQLLEKLLHDFYSTQQLIKEK